MVLRRLVNCLFLALLGVFILPVLAVLTSWIDWGSGSLASVQILLEMVQTVLPDYAWTTFWLCLMVCVGVISIGLSCATVVTLFDFPGRKFFEWALLLPLAMPAYVVAYAYTDFLQFGGPFQTTVRALLNIEGRVFPEVRSLAGAACVFTLTLYPYVYLLARSAMSERASHLMEAARLLGAPLSRRIREVALPLARPAVAAGVALALMETLADFGVSSYFGIQTFTTGIYKAWLSMDNQRAAAQLATMLLILVIALLSLDHHAQKRMRFSAKRGSGAEDAKSVELSGRYLWLAWAVCSLPLLLGFMAPVLFMLRPLILDGSSLPWDRFMGWAYNSIRLGLITAALAVGLALLLAYQFRVNRSWLTRTVVQIAGLGYAIPGAVIVVGLLLPVGWLQAAFPQSSVGYYLTATPLGLVWAYLIRFCAVALQSIQSGYSRVPQSLDDSARMLGAGGWMLMQRVHAPLLRRSTAAAALLVFVDVMKELPATLVLRPFNSDTLAVVAYQLARDERLGEAALPCLALVFAGLLPVILLNRTLRSGN